MAARNSRAIQSRKSDAWERMENLRVRYASVTEFVGVQFLNADRLERLLTTGKDW